MTPFNHDCLRARTMFRPARSVGEPITGRAPGWSGPSRVNNKSLDYDGHCSRITEQICYGVHRSIPVMYRTEVAFNSLVPVMG